jgi:hypothetical protein
MSILMSSTSLIVFAKIITNGKPIHIKNYPDKPQESKHPLDTAAEGAKDAIAHHNHGDNMERDVEPLLHVTHGHNSYRIVVMDKFKLSRTEGPPLTSCKQTDL